MSSGVEFDEDRWLSNRQAAPGQGGAGIPDNQYARSTSAKGFTGWLISHGIAKSEKSAQIIELVIIGLNFLITIYVIKGML